MWGATIQWDIDLSTEKLTELCAVLNEFGLPRAIVDFERNRFVAWNQRFLEQTGLSEDEIKSAKPEDLIAFGESWFPLSNETGVQTNEYVACTARKPFGGNPAPGFVVRSQGKIGYVMLDVFDSTSAQFEQGQEAGREEERNRIIKAFHQEVSSSMIAALFLIETIKSELEEAGAPQAEAASKAADILTETAKKMVRVVGEADQASE